MPADGRQPLPAEVEIWASGTVVRLGKQGRPSAAPEQYDADRLRDPRRPL